MASGQAFEGSELDRIHEDLNALCLGHRLSMHMCMCMSTERLAALAAQMAVPLS